MWSGNSGYALNHPDYRIHDSSVENESKDEISFLFA